MKRLTALAATLIALGVGLALQGSARAQEAGSASLGLGISTMGATIEGGYRITPRMGVRGLYAGLPDYSDTIEVDNINYDVDGRLGGFALMGDYFPNGGALRLSAGVFVSNSELSGRTTASPSNPIEVGGTTFTTGETVQTDVEFRNSIAPMATLGYVYQTRSRFSLSAEAGVIGNNGFDVDVTGSGVPQSELDAEAANVRDDLDDYKVYPFVSLMVGFRF